MLVDSHAHLEMFGDEATREQVVQNAKKADVTTILTVGTNLADSQTNIEIAHTYPQVFASVGIHPHNAKDVDTRTLAQELKTLAADEKVVAIGEIGLDFFRNISPPTTQRAIFRQQLELALELRLPVIIHDRDAHQEVMQILEEYDMSSVRGVLHCFSGDLVLATQVIAMGFYVSIAGPITYKNAEHLPEVVANLPLEALLIETDCPYLAPVPLRGKRNEPAYVRYIAEKVAEIRGITVAEVAERTSRNFANLFKLNDS